MLQMNSLFIKWGLMQQGIYLKFACYSTSIISKTLYYPDAQLPSRKDIIMLNDFLSNTNHLLIVSGAGLSTESGIPDYRSKDVGLYARRNHKPINHHEFIASSKTRQKYWARNFFGHEHFKSRIPNPAHVKLFEMKKQGKAHWHVTQNVDGLQSKAGSTKITELHGCMNRVICLNCQVISSRELLQKRFKEINKNWSPKVEEIGPDADAFIKDEDVKEFNVPSCEHCGGILKPDVVFFGDNVLFPKVQSVYKKVDNSDGVLVVGSSLYVWSGYRFVQRAFKNSIPIVAINVGPTRADHLFSHKIDALCSKVLSEVFL